MVRDIQYHNLLILVKELQVKLFSFLLKINIVRAVHQIIRSFINLSLIILATASGKALADAVTFTEAGTPSGNGYVWSSQYGSSDPSTGRLYVLSVNSGSGNTEISAIGGDFGANYKNDAGILDNFIITTLNDSNNYSFNSFDVYNSAAADAEITIKGYSERAKTNLICSTTGIAIKDQWTTINVAGCNNVVHVDLDFTDNTELYFNKFDVTAADATAPTLSSSTPADNATAVGVSSNIVLNFSEAVDVESGNITIKKTSDNSTVETIDVTSGQVTDTGTTAITINPGSDLSGETEYYVLVDATAFDDAAGNSYVGISSTTALSFITADVDSPTLSSSTPADGATGVAVDANIVLTFSEAVDTETGNIVLKKSSDDSTVETFDVASSGLISGSGTTEITINPTSNLDDSTGYYVTIAATAFDDSSSNSYTGISSTTALSFITADVDSPTLSSSTPADGATGVAVDANIVLTFSEAVDTETGNIVLKKSSDDSTVETFDVASSGLISGSGTTEITINPTSNLDDSTGYYVTIAATAFDDSSSNSYTGISNSTTLNFTTGTSALPTPLNKPDVLSSVESWTNAASRWSKDNLKAISDRLSWLNRNHGSVNTSHQGVKLTFNNEIIDAVMNTTPQTKEAIAGKLSKHIDPAKQAISLLSNTENALLAKSNEITSDAQMVAINEAARLREDTIGSLNPSFKPVYDDWSMWTAGQITLGEVDATTSSSEQDSKDIAITLGFDKPFYDDGLVGWSLSLGQTKTNVGTSTTQVKSDNYGLSGYSVIKQDNGNIIESILGLGHLKFDTTRKDGSATLTGKRDANQAFASISIKNDNTTFKQDNWSITPYGKASASYTELDKFSETGASTALTYNKQTVNEAKLYVGADATYLVTISNGTLTPFAKIEYGRDVSGGSDATMHYNSEATEYTLNLDKAATETWKLGLGTDIQTKDGWTGSFGYEREQAIGSGHSDSLKLDAKLKF